MVQRAGRYANTTCRLRALIGQRVRAEPRSQKGIKINKTPAKKCLWSLIKAQKPTEKRESCCLTLSASGTGKVNSTKSDERSFSRRTLFTGRTDAQKGKVWAARDRSDFGKKEIQQRQQSLHGRSDWRMQWTEQVISKYDGRYEAVFVNTAERAIVKRID